MGKRQKLPLELQESIFYRKVEDYFQERSEIALAQLFQSIIDGLSSVSSEAATVEIAIPKATKSGFDKRRKAHRRFTKG